MTHRMLRPFAMAAIAIVFTGAGLLLAGCQSSPTPAPTPSNVAAARPASTATAIKVATPAATVPVTAVPTKGGSSMGKQYAAAPTMTLDIEKSYTAIIHTTLGDMQAELFVKDAPVTVNSFVFLARDSYFTDIKFHRIIKDFMVQTGDPTGTGAGGPGYRFKDEPVTRKYLRGTLAMANAGPNTNGSQFFIVHQDYPLQPNYTIFGQISSGLDVLDKIASTPVKASARGEMSVPVQDVLMTSVEIIEK